MGNIGIPTVLNVTEYRSRLEAKWAAMFDLLGWRYTYEPFDLDGYIPDFCFNGWETPTIVEVKPATTTKQLEDAFSKIRRSGWNKNVLMLGATLQTELDHRQYPLGLTTCGVDWGGQDTLGLTDLALCDRCNSIFPYTWEGSYRCVVCGRNDGDHHMRNPDLDIHALWAKAGNTVKWRR